ncbi:hypothetical protein F2P81_020532 [Scophthalmus maximus]|uniref:Uncharacterized protein n=1 Tax=Scophthalmus maximus TaxID=52904 RepID=A0A6A4S9M3_SCOMX|nr:hypothetical protein F2P81_020532 [Scophthalmus maximus]
MDMVRVDEQIRFGATCEDRNWIVQFQFGFVTDLFPRFKDASFKISFVNDDWIWFYVPREELPLQSVVNPRIMAFVVQENSFGRVQWGESGTTANRAMSAVNRFRDTVLNGRLEAVSKKRRSVPLLIKVPVTPHTLLHFGLKGHFTRLHFGQRRSGGLLKSRRGPQSEYTNSGSHRRRAEYSPANLETLDNNSIGTSARKRFRNLNCF